MTIIEQFQLEHPIGRASISRGDRNMAMLGRHVSAAFSGPGVPIEQRFTRMLDAACVAFGAEHGFVTVKQRSRFIVRYAGTAGISASSGVRRTEVSRWISTRKKPVTTVVSDARSVDGHDPGSFAPHRYIAAPILFDGQIYGTLELCGGCPEQPPYGPLERAMIEMLCVISAAPLVLLGTA